MIQSLSASAIRKRTRTPGVDRRAAGLRGTATPTLVYAAPPARNVLPIAQFEAAALDWLRDGTARLSPKTVIERRGLVGKLLWWLRRENATQVGRAELSRFFAYLPVSHLEPGGRWGTLADETTAKRHRARAQKPLAAVSCANYFRWLRTLFLYLVAIEVLDESPMKTLRPAVHRDHQIQPFSEEQVNDLLKAARQTEYPSRNLAIVLFLVDTGARAGELCAIKHADVNLRERSVRVCGKGSKERTLFFDPATLRVLQEYERELGNGDSPYLFGSQRGDAMTPSALQSLFATLGKIAGLTGVRCSPHTARHTFAVRFLRKGGDPFSLQMLMGHTDLAQTRRYVAFAGADIQKNHGRFSPVAGLKIPRTKKG